MVRFVNLLASAVRRFPWPTIVAVLVLFGVLGSFISEAEQATQNAGFAPDAPELTASETISELFGDDSAGTVMQVVVSSEGGDVITAEGLATVETVTQVLEDSELAVDLQETPQGSVFSFLAPIQPLDAGQGPSARIVVGTDGGDVFTTDGSTAVAAVTEAAAGVVGPKLDTAAPTGPVSSFLTPITAAAAQGPGAQVMISAEGGDVFTSEGLQASLALQQAVFQSPLAAKLPPLDQFPPPSASFLTPAEFAVQQGQLPPDAPTAAVKQAWLGAFAALPADATEFIPFLASNDQDLSVPEASAGLVSFSFVEPLTAEDEAILQGIIEAVPLADGYEMAYLPLVPTDDAALKATYAARAAFLPSEAAEFLPFLSSNEADLSIPAAEKGLVVLSLTADLTAEESRALADALSEVDVPAGYEVGYLPVDPTTPEIKQAYVDNLAFIPEEFAAQVSALISDDRDAEAVTASSGLMIVFLAPGGDVDEEAFAEFNARQAAFADDLAAAELPEGYTAGAFSLGLIFSSGGDFTNEIGRMFGLAFAIIIVVLLFNFWVRIRGRRGAAIRRTLADTVLTLVTIVIAIAWMQGIGVLMGPKYLGWIGAFNELVQILPILIIGLGVDYGIHMTSRYREELAAGNDVSDSIRHAIRTVGVALVLATMTTVVGFLTNLVSPVPALQDFGILASVGIVSAFILMLTFVPAVRLLLDSGPGALWRPLVAGSVVGAALGAVGGVAGGAALGERAVFALGGAAVGLAVAGIGVLIAKLGRSVSSGPVSGSELDLEADSGFIWPLVFGALGGVGAYLVSVFIEAGIEGAAFGDVLETGQMGIFAAIGAVVGITLLQLPRITAGVSVVAEKFAWGVVIIAIVLAGIGEYGRQQLETSFSFTDFVPSDNPLLETFDTILEDFGGGFGETTSVLVGGEGEDVATVAVHNAQADAWDNLRDTPDVTQFGDDPAVDVSPIQVIIDLTDPRSEIYDEAFVSETDGLLDGYRVTGGTDVVALYDLMADYAPEATAAALHADGSGGYDAALWTINTSAGDVAADELRTNLQEDFAPVEEAGAPAIPTSENIISVVVIDSLAASQLSSLLITLAAATLLLVINFWIEARRPVLGILTMLPVGLVVLLTFGMMALRGIPFGPVTATISALAVGIGVPFTIHITHRFLEDRVRMGSTEEAIRSTTRHTGAALTGSAFTTMAGFGSLVTSSLTPFQQFGEVTFWAIFFALLGSLVLLPSMLVIWDRYHRRRGDELLDSHQVEEALGLDT